MKTLIKIALAVLVVNACFQAGRAYMANYQFEDDMQSVATFSGPRPKPEDLINRVMDMAEERQLPVTRDNVEVTMDRIGITISATYQVNVTLVPSVYTHTFVFSPTVSARSLAP